MKNENFIADIYNYCDRWCERCTFTSRCRNYEGTSQFIPEQIDIQNEAFWKLLSDQFKDTIILLKKTAEKFGIDIKEALSAENVLQSEKKEKEVLHALKKHPLSQLSLAYTKLAKDFIENNNLVKEKGDELLQQMELGIQSEKETLDTALRLKDCLEVIQWYLFFIHVKFQRALHGEAADDGWEAANGIQRDFDGSAKVALISLERTMNAWVLLYNLLPSAEDNVLPILSLLQQIKKRGEEEFPKAYSFKRPGFDD